MDSTTLARTMPAATAFRQVLLGLADEAEANWQAATDTDDEVLHDLRIALRRTRAVLAQSADVLSSTTRARFGRELARLAGATGPSRDLDVLEAGWSHATDGFDAGEREAAVPVLDEIRRRRVAARTELAGVFAADHSTDVLAAWRAELLIDPARGAGAAGRPDDADRPIGRVLARRFRRAHHRLQRHGRRIDETSSAGELHDLRKDAKKLRYLVECFADLMPDRARKRFVEQLKVLQDNLGEHQDAVVHAAVLRDIADGLPRGSRPATFLAVGRLIERVDRTERATRAEFTERFAAYDSPSTRHAVDRICRALRAD
ncbi:MAG: hypothetical protein JWM34_4195 [Ilumatobacteraceae bacterium]|nr:hypothetical protein [Ilumatobacteraceae bacterium]